MSNADAKKESTMGLELGEYCRLCIDSLFAQQIFSQAMRLDPGLFDPDLIQKLKTALTNKLEVFNSFEDVKGLEQRSVITRLISTYLEAKQLLFEEDNNISFSSSGQEAQISSVHQMRIEILSSIQHLLMNLANKIGLYSEFADKISEMDPLATVMPRIPTLPYGQARHYPNTKFKFDPSKKTEPPVTGMTQEMDMNKIVSSLPKEEVLKPEEGETDEAPLIQPDGEPHQARTPTSLLPPPPPESRRASAIVVITGDEDEKVHKHFRDVFWKMMDERSPEIFAPERIEQAVKNIAMMAFVQMSGEPDMKNACKSYADRKTREGLGSAEIAFELATRILKKDAREWAESYLDSLIKRIVDHYKDKGLAEKLFNMKECDLDGEVHDCAETVFSKLQALIQTPEGFKTRKLMYYFMADTPEQARTLFGLIYDILYVRFVNLKNETIKDLTSGAVSDLLKDDAAKATDTPVSPGGVMPSAESPVEQPASIEQQPAVNADGVCDVPEIDSGELTEDELTEEDRRLLSLPDLIADDEPEETGSRPIRPQIDGTLRPAANDEEITSVMYFGPMRIPQKITIPPPSSRVVVAKDLRADCVFRPSTRKFLRYDVDNDVDVFEENGREVNIPRIKPAAGEKAAESSDQPLTVRETVGVMIDESFDEPVKPEPKAEPAPEEKPRSKPEIKVVMPLVATLRPGALDEKEAVNKAFEAVAQEIKAKVKKVLLTVAKGAWKGIKIGAAAGAMLYAGNHLYTKCSTDNDQSQQVARVTASGTAADEGKQPSNATKEVTKDIDEAKAKKTVDSTRGVKMEIDHAKIPAGQKLAKNLMERGVYPEGLEKMDHATKLLFIFGQNLTDAERVRINGVRDQYNRGAYAEVISTFRGKSNKEMWEINNNPSHPLYRQLKNAQSALGEQDWNKWSWEVKKLTTENGKLVFKKMPYEQVYADDMAFYKLCRNEFVQMGLYSNNAQLDGNMSTFASRLVMARNWGQAVSSNANQVEAPSIPEPPADLLQRSPQSPAPANNGTNVDMDGGVEFPEGGLGFNKAPAGERENVEAKFFATAEEQKTLDDAWDMEEELTENDIIADEPASAAQQADVLTADDIIDEIMPQTAPSKTAQFSDKEKTWFAEGEEISKQNIKEEKANREWVAAYPEWFPNEQHEAKPSLLSRAVSGIKGMISPREKTMEEKLKEQDLAERKAQIPKKSFWRNLVG